MDSLLSDFRKLEKNGGLADSIGNVERLEQLLVAVRNCVGSGMLLCFS